MLTYAPPCLGESQPCFALTVRMIVSPRPCRSVPRRTLLIRCRSFQSNSYAIHFDPAPLPIVAVFALLLLRTTFPFRCHSATAVFLFSGSLPAFSSLRRFLSRPCFSMACNCFSAPCHSGSYPTSALPYRCRTDPGFSSAIPRKSILLLGSSQQICSSSVPRRTPLLPRIPDQHTAPLCPRIRGPSPLRFSAASIAGPRSALPLLFALSCAYPLVCPTFPLRISRRQPCHTAASPISASPFHRPSRHVFAFPPPVPAPQSSALPKHLATCHICSVSVPTTPCHDSPFPLKARVWQPRLSISHPCVRRFAYALFFSALPRPFHAFPRPCDPLESTLRPRQSVLVNAFPQPLTSYVSSPLPGKAVRLRSTLPCPLPRVPVHCPRDPCFPSPLPVSTLLIGSIPCRCIPVRTFLFLFPSKLDSAIPTPFAITPCFSIAHRIGAELFRRRSTRSSLCHRHTDLSLAFSFLCVSAPSRMTAFPCYSMAGLSNASPLPFGSYRCCSVSAHI